MSTLLGIDTVSAETLAVGLRLGGETVLGTRRAGFEHSRALLSLVDDILPDDVRVDGIVVAVGPGAYAGLRAGIAAAEGLGMAWGVPVVGVGTLEAVAAAAGGTVLAVHPAGRGDIAAQRYAEGVAVEEIQIVAPEDLMGGDAAGEGGAALGGREVTADERCSAMLELGAIALAAGDAGIVEPFYLREPHITAPRRSRMSGAGTTS
ncbi:MAG TPA: tRNA (adenosine(37)-N6)-threonylcarbamoyltransferase complex dimerization subunit type 1 TsaB [Tepidiformaceae bacterium]|nr:tRNA (adenosine(37)-N6)-threonylcarbamoyltransferase complex dimerization subunit type 1 TsaB [Tepidiformaceae bacterium]